MSALRPDWTLTPGYSQACLHGALPPPPPPWSVVPRMGKSQAHFPSLAAEEGTIL